MADAATNSPSLASGSLRAPAALALLQLVEAELARPAPESARRLAEEIRERCGPATAAIVFYGSCLRRGTDEGVLDFYAVVDDYGSAYASRALAWANAALPPNVFYFELPHAGATLRTKYAVVSARDLERGTAGRMLRPCLWARFCQPLLAVYVRDDAAQRLVAQAAARSIETAVERAAPLLAGADGSLRSDARALWERCFRETYGYEMRPERPEATAELYRADAERFDRAAALAVAALAERGRIEGEAGPDALTLRLPPARASRARRAWRWRRPLARAVTLLGLGKTTFTFGEWLPYALWKLERHSGTRLVPSERQRRHPLVFGWPLLFKAFRRGALR